MQISRTGAAALLGTLLTLAACSAGTSEDVGASEAAQSELCGNGTRDPGEQCDDSNTSNLDGCSKTCQFEQTHRLNSVELMFGTDSFCTKNALGGAIRGVAQGQLQDALGNAIKDQTLSVFLSFSGLADLSGQTPSPVTLGSFIGDPVAGASGVDGWYTANPDALDADGTPIVAFPGNIGAGGALTAGPGNFAFGLTLGSVPANVSLSNARAKAQLGAATALTASTGTSPGHLASSNIDPTLSTFESTSGGQLCGSISAASLAAISVPEMLTSGTFSCTQGYTTANSMLDVIVGGCKVLFITALGATQPDDVSATAPAAGAGGNYTLTVGAGRKVTGCKDKSGAAVDLDACLQSSAYSAGFKFTTQRAVVRGTTP